MADDVIYLSSDDDFQETMPKKKPTVVNKKPVKVKRNDKLKKRKSSTELDTSKPKKRIQPTQIDKPLTNYSWNNYKTEMTEVVSNKESSNPTSSHNKSTSDDSNRPSTSKAGSVSETTRNGPKLVIKEKRPVDNTQDGSGVFAQFLSQCLMKDRSPDMKKIVDRLKRHYEQTDPAYKNSSAFINLLNEKRDSLMKDGKVYVHIGDIDTEMKCRKRDARAHPREEEEDEEEEEGEAVDEATAELRQKNYSKIRLIEKAMEKCKKRIKEHADAEVDWDDDDNSNYMKQARYEEKMAQLYYKLCELTGDDGDAGRRYLRPKFLKVTKIEEVDQAIISFMNQKLKDKRKKMQKGLSTADCVIFPDYCDILKCIQKCNDDKKLRMNKSSMEKLAERAFRDLGNYLQKLRREDLLDGISLMLENEVDPAQQNPELLRRLEESKLRGIKRLDGVFEEFAKKQEEGSIKANDTDSDAGEDKNDKEEEEEDEEEDDDDDDDGKHRPDEDDSDIDIDVESVSQQGSDDTVITEKRVESPIDPLEIEKDQWKDNGATHAEPLGMGDASDSAETVIIPPSESINNPQVVVTNKLFVQPYKVVSDVGGTVTVDDKYVPPEKSSTDSIQLNKTPRPGPKSSKISPKPSITNIESVRVVIKAHEIVRVDEKAETLAVSNDSTSNSASENKLENAKLLLEKAEVDKSSLIVNDENTSFSVNTSKTLEGGEGVKSNSKILQEKQGLQIIAKESNSLRKAGIVENQEITSSTEDNIGKTESPEITLLEDEDIIEKNAAVTDNDSPSPDSTLKVADLKKTENTKVNNESENEVRPVLKLRSFAKPPDFWTNSPEKRTLMMKSTKPMVTPSTIEVVDLENSRVRTNKLPARTNTTVGKSLKTAGTPSASALSQILLMPVDITGKPLANRSTSSQPTIIRLVDPAKSTKTRVIGSPLQTKILPMTSAQTPSTPLQNARPLIRPIQNTTVGSSSVLQKPNKSVRINPVNRQALATHSPDRLVNPVSLLKIVHKRQ